MRKPAFYPPIALALALIVPGSAVGSDPVWLSKLDSGQTFEAGQVAGLFGGGVSLSTAGADRVLVVAAAQSGSKSELVPVELAGRVAIMVIGPVRAGDLVFASGRNDGSAVAVAASELAPARLPLLVGRALEANPVTNPKSIQVLVGVPEWEALVELFEARDALIEAQETELAELRRRVAELEELTSVIESLRQATERLEALEAAREAEDLAPLPLRPE